MRLIYNNLQQHRLEVAFDFAGETISRLKRDIVNSQKRTGVTLTEVLMSLMIMSIGVSAVAVLFPVSTLRAIQANQLTHGAIVKYNVEALLQADPKWVIVDAVISVEDCSVIDVSISKMRVISERIDNVIA